MKSQKLIPYFSALLIILTASLTTKVLAQQKTFFKKVISKVEIVAGPSLLRNTGYFQQARTTKIGYSFGLGITHSFSKSFDLTLRGLWELKGNDTRYNFGRTTVDPETYTNISERLETNLRYFTLNLLPTLRIGHKKNILVGAGGYYSFARNASILVTDTDLHTNISSQYNYTDVITAKYDVGMSAFIGYAVPISQRSDFSVQLMYNKAFMDINDNFNGYQRNQVFQLMFTFSLKH